MSFRVLKKQKREENEDALSFSATRRAIRGLLILSSLVNLALFLSGLLLGMMREDLVLLAGVLSVTGLLGMAAFAITWIKRPELVERAAYVEKKRRRRSGERRRAEEARLDPQCADTLIKNIRGIPFLIQAIQYSMETSLYRDLLTEMSDGVVRTSVIHTAPACQSVLDSETDEMDEEEEHKAPASTPRHSAEEQWLPFGESWRNEQLRLSLESGGNANLLVFPLRESTPVHEPFDEGSTPELNRIDSIRRERGKALTGSRAFQVRCIGQSASFLARFSSGLGSFDSFILDPKMCSSR